MIIKLFESFNNITYMEYCLFCSKFKGEPGKKQELKKIDTTNTNLNISYYRDKSTQVEVDNDENNSVNKIVLKDYDIKSLRKKVFTLKKGIYKKKISFEENYKCQFCGELNGTTFLAINLINKKKSELMLCSKCKKYLEPKINIVSGNDKYEFKIYSPIKLLSIAKEIAMDHEKIDLDELREKYSSFYWSCILYFYLNGFNYEMLMVYRTNEMNFGKNKNNNLKKFKKLQLEKQNI